MRRKHRGAVYFYTSTKAGGITTVTRTRQLSPDSDGLWWLSRGAPRGTEPTVGMQPNERIDSVIGALTEVAINRNSVIVLEGETQQHVVLSVLPRDQNRAEWQALCQIVPAQTYTLSEPAP